jgi:hypothetical protein
VSRHVRDLRQKAVSQDRPRPQAEVKRNKRIATAEAQRAQRFNSNREIEKLGRARFLARDFRQKAERARQPKITGRSEKPRHSTNTKRKKRLSLSGDGDK